jgi:hypothetical protein
MEAMTQGGGREEGFEVPQARLDQWRAFTEQNRTDLLTLRQLVAQGQAVGATQLIAGMLESTLIAGLAMEDAGANRPATLPPKPRQGLDVK